MHPCTRAPGNHSPLPSCFAGQTGFVNIYDAKYPKATQVKKPCKESFVLECAMSPDLRYIVTGGMQNAIQIYDTTKATESPYTQKTGMLSDPDPALDFCAHDGYIAALEFIQGACALCAVCPRAVPHTG